MAHPSVSSSHTRAHSSGPLFPQISPRPFSAPAPTPTGAIPARAVMTASVRPSIPSTLHQVYLLELINRSCIGPAKVAAAIGRTLRASLSRPTYPSEASHRCITHVHLACHVLSLGYRFPCLDYLVPPPIGTGPAWSTNKRCPETLVQAPLIGLFPCQR
jgi:hypothetical protein